MEENINIEESAKPDGERLKEEETISIPQNPDAPSTLNLPTLNLQTPDMEVHQHTHPSHGKKTWKDYITTNQKLLQELRKDYHLK